MKILTIVCLLLSINLSLEVKLTEDNFSLKDLLVDSQHTIINIFKSGSNPQIKNNIYEKDFAPIIKIDKIERTKKSDTVSPNKDTPHIPIGVIPHFDDDDDDTSDELESDDEYLDSILNEKEDKLKPPTFSKVDNGYTIDQIKTSEGNRNSTSRIINIYESGSNPKIKNNFYEKDFAPVIKISDAETLRQQIGLRKISNEPTYQISRTNLNPESNFGPRIPDYRRPPLISEYREGPPDFRSRLPVYRPLTAYKSDSPESQSPSVAYNQVQMGGFSFGPQNSTNSLNPQSNFESNAPGNRSPPLVSEYSLDPPDFQTRPPGYRPFVAYKPDSPKTRSPAVGWGLVNTSFGSQNAPNSLNPQSKFRPDESGVRSPPVVSGYKPDSPEVENPPPIYRPYTPFKSEPEIPSPAVFKAASFEAQNSKATLNPESKSRLDVPDVRSLLVPSEYKPDSPEIRNPPVAYTKPPVL